MSSMFSSKERVEEWRRLATARNAALAAVTERLLVRAGIGQGMRVLVLGAGTGDDAAIVAERTGPGGRVVATDLSPAMVDACAAAMSGLGATHVECRVMDAAAVDVPPGTFDAVVSRNGLMFTPRFDRALAGARSALRPGGRFAMSSWAALDRNPFHDTLVEVARRFGPVSEDLEIVRAYSLSDPDRLSTALKKAGFAEVTVERVAVPRRFGNAAEAIAFQQKSPAAGFFAHFSDADREAAWAAAARQYARFETPAGFFVDGESLVSAGCA
jgi:ubiquinone/menaquinone biosynthesis C-methylase UbiE